MKYCFKQKKGLKGKATESFEDCSVVKILLPSYCRSRAPGYCKIETEEKLYLEKHYAFEHGSIVSQLDEGAWLRLRLGQDCVEMHHGTVSGDELIFSQFSVQRLPHPQLILQEIEGERRD